MLEWMEDLSLQMKGWKSAVPALFDIMSGLSSVAMKHRYFPLDEIVRNKD